MVNLCGWLVLFAAVSANRLGADAPKDTRPNIVFILVDDMGWSDPGCYGHPWHQTPAIDALAATGVRFTDAYSPAPICSAARAAFLTGRYPARLGFEFVTKDDPGDQRIDAETELRAPPLTLELPLEEQTMAESLGDLGYQTAFFGKWHVARHHEHYLGWHPQFGPDSQGFSVTFESFGSHPYGWRKDAVPKTSPREGTFPGDALFDACVEFIASEHGRPFFCFLSTYHVHTPVQCNVPWLLKKYQSIVPRDAVNRGERIRYAAFMEILDHQIGRVLGALDRPTNGRDTMVVFTSDNGGHPIFTDNGPLRGSKWNLYEGGIRVPAIVRWPKRVDAGVIDRQPIHGVDWHSTLVSVAGGDPSPKVDGAVPSVLRSSTPPTAKQESRHASNTNATRVETEDVVAVFGIQPQDRPLIWHFPYYHPETGFAQALPKIGNTDFAVSKTRPHSAIRWGRWKLLWFAEDGRRELYDLEADLEEQQDLASEHPGLADRLENELSRRLLSMNARMPTRDGNAVTISATP